MKYYEKTDACGDPFNASDFMDCVAWHLGGILDDKTVRYLFIALKYPLRAGEKDPWMVDARKCADYICKAFTDRFLREHDEAKEAGE